VDGEREVSLEEFLKGPYKTSLKKGEIIHSFILRKHKSGGENFYKLGRRDAMNKARMNFALWMDLEGGRIEGIRFSGGAMTPKPVRFREVEEYLLGKSPDDEFLREAAKLVSKKILEITGLRWSTPYKNPVSERLALTLLRETTRGI
jgi:carbon-monoxide dehydrogenase medium subunit/xanthine dehydrogenase FAD-binding subunit